MSRQFKPGDLAIVVGCEKRPALIGSVVELVRRVTAGETFASPDGDLLTSISAHDSWVVAADGIVSVIGRVGWANVAERHLMPLRGDFDFAKELELEVVHG